eukprot:CAMPEP_0184864116 /NCGR_PEP_ID=MMETSP0580-20130426/13857_1 /TAXON_ID=1118495 /ORGANISM="Dactyliosolen fragilissimus" /LENGTH=766 /DNA_ID=CAMNT_0027362771 /DNA_START=386 /DNA_END=2687 /DNA_ORIENTATION=-
MRSLRSRNLKEKYNVDWATVLGEGAYGSVYPARLVATGEKVALKKISKRYTNTSSFRAETDALLRIYSNGGHPNISGLRDMYEDFDHFYLVMDLVSGGEMFDHLIEYGAYSEADAARLVQEVASALAFLHGVGVVHADLKPENLLLCSKKRYNGTIKIIDFGCAVLTQDNYHDDDDIEEEYNDAEMRPKTKSGVDEESEFSNINLKTGTTAYSPPERFLADAEPDAATDMWALGIILYIMLTGVHPFDLTGMATDEEIERRIRKDPSPPITPELTSHLSPYAIDLLRKLFAADPKQRISAYDMLQHPWIAGDEARTDVIERSAQKLSSFKDLRAKIEAGIFSLLIESGNRETALGEYAPKMVYRDDHKVGDDRSSPPTSVLKKAFEAFDEGGKGFLTTEDLERVVSLTTGESLTEIDRKDMLEATNDGNEKTSLGSKLSLSHFSNMFSGLKRKHFLRGHIIFEAGDEGNAMYFINSGKVEIQTRKGQLVHILRHGDFFGEGSLLEDNNKRFSTARCATPVDVIKIKKEDFQKYMENSKSARDNLKFKWKARTLADAKSMIRLQTKVKERKFHKNDVVYREGDMGKSMYTVDEKNGGMLDVMHGGIVVHQYHSGESFGESSLLLARPRSSTVVCASESCILHEMQGKHFLAFLETSPETKETLLNMCRKRLFKKAVKAHSLENQHGLSNDDLVKAFHSMDLDKSGSLSLDEIRRLMHAMDPTISEVDIIQLLKFIDVDEDGQLSFDDFNAFFGNFNTIRAKIELHTD